MPASPDALHSFTARDFDMNEGCNSPAAPNVLPLQKKSARAAAGDSLYGRDDRINFHDVPFYVRAVPAPENACAKVAVRGRTVR